jgi:hypothetical protein
MKEVCPFAKAICLKFSIIKINEDKKRPVPGSVLLVISLAC